jgi:hypothetical protein
MKHVWARVTDQLDRIPSGCGLPLVVLTGVVLWVVVLKLMGV